MSALGGPEIEHCSDAIDNDDDGRVDRNDPDCTTPARDLGIVEVTAPAVARTGWPVALEIGVRIANQGQMPAESRVGFYLSLDRIPDASDHLIGGRWMYWSLPPGNEGSWALYDTARYGVPPDGYYLLIEIERSDDDPSDNLAIRPITILSDDPVLNPDKENDFIVSLIPEGFWLRVGGYQDPGAPDYAESAGGWRWVTGEPFAFNRWAANEPSQGRGMDERFLMVRRDGFWNDIYDVSLGDVVEFEPDQSRISRGDLDGNGTVDGDDVRIVLRILIGRENGASAWVGADVDGSGQVDLRDVRILLKKSLGLTI